MQTVLTELSLVLRWEVSNLYGFRALIPSLGMAADPVRQQIEQLRARRVRPERGRDAREVFAAAARDFTKRDRHYSVAAEAWGEVCPRELAARTAIVGFARGVLTIGVSDAATRFEIDRVLRAGAERELVRRMSTTLRKVRLEVRQGTGLAPGA